MKRFLRVTAWYWIFIFMLISCTISIVRIKNSKDVSVDHKGNKPSVLRNRVDSKIDVGVNPKDTITENKAH